MVSTRSRTFLSIPEIIASTFVLLVVIGAGGDVLFHGGAHAFQLQPTTARSRLSAPAPSSSYTKTPTPPSSSSSLGMAPRYDKETQTWFASDPETEGPAAGYNLLGSLYRAGPVPVVQRIFNPTSYEQAVLKYMAKEQCSRMEAMGNMDAYLENPNDWAYQKMAEKEKGAAVKDYANANMEPKQIILSTIWAGVVVVFGYDLITGVAEGRYGPGEGNTNTLFNGNLWSLPIF